MELKVEVKEISRNVLVNTKVKSFTIYPMWDSHGRYVKWGENAIYKNAQVRVERVKREYSFGTYEHDEVFINDKRYEAIDFAMFRGDNNEASCVAIVGEG